MKINIGGAKPVPPPAAPSAAPAPAAASVKLNIGGTSTPPIASSNPSAPSSAAPSKPVTPAPSVVKPAGKEFNFTSDKAKTDAEKILNDTLAVADKDTLKDLYGDEEVVDTNGQYFSDW